MSDFEPQNPDFAAMVRARFAEQGLMRALGIELAEIAPGTCVLEAAAHSGLTQQHGFFHGALIGAMPDCAGGYAAYSLMPAGSDVLTTEYKINFIAAALGERLLAWLPATTSVVVAERQARGRVIKPGRTLTVATAEAFCRRDGALTLCAVLLQSLICIPGRP